MSSRYGRPLSPPDPRIVPAGSIVYATNETHPTRRSRDAYPPQRASVDRVIPISTQTYVNGVPVSTSTRGAGFDAYGDSRRAPPITTDVPQRRGSVLSAASSARSSRGTIVSNDRPSSPVTRTAKYKYDTDYHVPPASSTSKLQQKKIVYGIDEERGARPLNEKSDRGTAASRAGSGYHSNGSTSKSTRADDYGGYEYTDARGMYNSTEPRTRTRRGSVEAPTDRRRLSIVDDATPARSSAREFGPPPTTRGLDKINNISRHGSLRDTPRSPQSYNREGSRGSYSEDDGVQARLMPTSQNPLVYMSVRDDLDPPPTETRRRTKYEDTSVGSRGFGIRNGNASGETYNSAASTVPQLLDAPIAVPYPRTSDLDLRGGYAGEPAGFADDYRSETSRSDHSRRDYDPRDRDGVSERKRDHGRDKASHGEGRRIKDRDYDDDVRSRHRDYRDRDRDRYDEDDRKSRDKRSEREDYRDRRDRDRDDKRNRDDEGSHATPEVLATLVGGAAALGAGGLLASRVSRDQQREHATERDDKRDDRDKRDRQRETRDRDADRENRERVRVMPETDERDKRERPRELPPTEERDWRDRPKEVQISDDRERRDRPRDVQPPVLVPAQVSIPPPDDRERKDRPRDAQPPVTAPPAEDRDRRERPREPPVVVAEDREKRDRPQQPQDNDERNRRDRRPPSPDEAAPRERHYVTKDPRRELTDEESGPPAALDPDEDYLRRLEIEKERFRQPKPAEDSSRESSDVNEPRRRHRDPHERRGTRDEDVRGSGASVDPQSDSQALTRFGEGPLVEEPSDAMIELPRENRVRIMEPNQETEREREKDAPRGILRKPTEKFPDYPDSVREGVAPLKDAPKKGVPPGARWTKIDRRLVNPAALKEAKERFEERQDCVIVLRVLTKEEIQKFAERTAELRGMLMMQ